MTHSLQIATTLLALVSVPAILLLGPRIQTSLGKTPHAWPFLAGWAGMIFLVDVPIGHSRTCGMAPSGETLRLVGIWWIPYATSSFAILACSARLVDRTAVRHPLLLVVGSLAILLERVASDSSHMRCWIVHLALQATLSVLAWLGLRPACPLRSPPPRPLLRHPALPPPLLLARLRPDPAWRQPARGRMQTEGLRLDPPFLPSIRPHPRGNRPSGPC